MWTNIGHGMNIKLKPNQVGANSLVVSASTYSAHGNPSSIPVLRSFADPSLLSVFSSRLFLLSYLLKIIKPH